MQNLINKYFAEMCFNKFFENSDESIIGKVKDVIKNLEENVTYINDAKNGVNKEDIDFITENTKELINEIKALYNNEEDIIQLQANNMLGFYTIAEKEELYNYLSWAYEDFKEQKDNERKEFCFYGNMEEKENNLIENFLKKCKNDLKEIEGKLLNSKHIKADLCFYCYMYEFCYEMFDLFKTNQGGVGIYAKLYKNEKTPLKEIFSRYIEKFTEPKLITANKLYKLLDKIQ